jgi:hypothetical protein
MIDLKKGNIKFSFMKKCQNWSSVFSQMVIVYFIDLAWNGQNNQYFKMCLTDEFEELKRAIDVISEQIKDENEVF